MADFDWPPLESDPEANPITPHSWNFDLRCTCPATLSPQSPKSGKRRVFGSAEPCLPDQQIFSNYMRELGVSEPWRVNEAFGLGGSSAALHDTPAASRPEKMQYLGCTRFSPVFGPDPDLLAFLPAPTVAAIVNVERLKKAEDKEKGALLRGCYWARLWS